MGHRDTSAQLGGHSEVFRAGGRIIEDVAASGRAGNSHTVSSGTSVREIHRPSSIGALVLLALVRVYQILFSPFLGGACKFYPSCSHYAMEAIQRHGAWRGFVLAMKRLGRCRPFTKGGFDPVPDENDHHATNANLRTEEPVN
jgi:uncharacterized protein